MNWVQANGSLRDMIAWGFMLELHRKGHITLPATRMTTNNPFVNRSLIEHHHYLGYYHPVGEQLKYVVFAGTRPVACFSWASTPRHIGARDRYIGRKKEYRDYNLCYIVYNSRFLILPWFKVPQSIP